jgi:hypothetical protein
MTRLQYTATETMIYYCLYGGKDRRAQSTSRSGPYGVKGSGMPADLGPLPKG